jgi:hypothetical protein
VPWVEIFAFFVVSHLVGDFVLQTDWQARNKRGGLGGDPVARRALASHVATYTLAFVPAFIWLGNEIGAVVIAVAALVAVPHLVQDDGRLLTSYIRVTKKSVIDEGDFVFVAVDQSFHVLTLFLVALVASG